MSMKVIVRAFSLLAHDGDGGGDDVDGYDDKYLDTLLLSWSCVI